MGASSIYKAVVDWPVFELIPLSAMFVNVPEPLARRVRDEFFPKSLIWPDEIRGLDSLMEEAVALKFVAAPLSKEQTAELISIPGARP